MPASGATLNDTTPLGQAVVFPVMVPTEGVEEVMTKHFAGLVKQPTLDETQSVPLVQVGPKFTVTLLVVPLTVASPVIDH